MPDPKIILDAEGALRRLCAKSDLYGRLVKRFQQNWLDAPDRLQLAIASDISAATLLAHALRGAAATIGGDGVASIARQIEAGLRAGRDVSAELPGLRAAMRSLAEMLAGLPAHFMAASEPDGPQDPPSARIR
ncbi:MAG: Hpt domain-containing protein [Verrucomicrobiae bacterium]